MYAPYLNTTSLTPVAPAHGEMDFETYSEAGYVWNEERQKWGALPGAPQERKGLNVVGANVYSEHPSTEVLTFRFKLPGDETTEHWRPGLPNPQRLFDYMARGGIMEAHNVMFEMLIWENVCVPKYGWPSILPWRYQLRCSMAKARVNALPGPLAELASVLGTTAKDKEGKRLLDKFSVPRNPTKKDARTRIHPQDDWDEFVKLDAYCHTDVMAEADASSRMYPLSEAELLFWWIDQEINWRGIAIDRKGVRDCKVILAALLQRYGDEHRKITGGLNPGQLAEVRGWLRAQGVYMDSMDAEAVEYALDHLPPHPPGGVWAPRRVLEIRALTGSASVKKLYAMDNQANRLDRLCNLIVHHGARTGRPTGEGPQPLNLPKAGPDLMWCAACDSPYAVKHAAACPWCAHVHAEPPKVREWSAAAADAVLTVMATHNLDMVEWFFGDAALAISGVIRSLFVAGPGMDLIASDYSSIESVVTAMLAGEQWRIDAFREGKPMYLVGAAKITGKTLEFYEAYKADHGVHHPDRQKIGKVSELACGFGGWIGAFKAFGFEGTDEEAKEIILGWRRASPAIVEMWGGQWRRGGYGEPPKREYYGFEGAAVQAIMYPGHVFTANGIKFYMRGDALIVQLLSGRELTYHQPRLGPATQEWAPEWARSITYMTWNTNPKYGAMGWVPMKTYGGRLTENIVQATAHDILRDAIIRLRAAGYPTVLHVYDEIVVEVPHGCGSVEEVERIMSTMPWWCADWPVVASGGWRGYRYRKG
jgi:DNA polymerase